MSLRILLASVLRPPKDQLAFYSWKPKHSRSQWGKHGQWVTWMKEQIRTNRRNTKETHESSGDGKGCPDYQNYIFSNSSVVTKFCSLRDAGRATQRSSEPHLVNQARDRGQRCLHTVNKTKQNKTHDNWWVFRELWNMAQFWNERLTSFERTQCLPRYFYMGLC